MSAVQVSQSCQAALSTIMIYGGFGGTAAKGVGLLVSPPPITCQSSPGKLATLCHVLEGNAIHCQSTLWVCCVHAFIWIPTLYWLQVWSLITTQYLLQGRSRSCLSCKGFWVMTCQDKNRSFRWHYCCQDVCHQLKLLRSYYALTGVCGQQYLV